MRDFLILRLFGFLTLRARHPVSEYSPPGRFRRLFAISLGLAVVLGGLGGPSALAEDRAPQEHSQAGQDKQKHLSLADTRLTWPSREHFVRVVSLQDYNTRVVALGTLLLGISGGMVGTFMLLRKRSLVGDVVSHASLPGVALAFIVSEVISPGSGKSLHILLAGALVAGLVAVACTIGIHKLTRVKQDAALAIVLSIFFGLGIALFTVVQNLPSGSAAGLQHFIFGKAASMIADDVVLIAQAAFGVLLVCGLLMKEFSLLCFDEDYATVQGWPVVWLDLILLGLVAGVTVIGLQSVGLLLMVAMLIIPAAAARFWTDRLGWMTFISALVGGASAFVGVLVSALFPRLAAGAVIVLVGSLLFFISMFCGARRGVLRRIWTYWSVKRKVGRHDLLRAFYECVEPAHRDARAVDLATMTSRVVPVDHLLQMRSWPRRRLEQLLSAAAREKLVASHDPGAYRLTQRGALEAARVVRNHRLWEIYLINYADVAPHHVDRDADMIEHVLEPALIEELDALWSQQYPQTAMPPSPHEIELPATATT